MNSRQRAAFLVFLAAFLIFKSSPLHPINDSKYSMMLSQCLIEHRSFQLDHYAIPRFPPIMREDYVENGAVYQIEQVGPHLYYFISPASSILSVPFVLIANAFGVSAVGPDKTFDLRGETIIEAWLAALLMAALAAVFFYTAQLMLPLGYSLLITAGGALGTQIWSTASRAMFTDTWAVLFLALVVFIVLAHEEKGAPLRPVVVGSLMAWAYLVYPPYAVHVAAIGIYILLLSARQFVVYVITGLCWAAGLVIYSWNHFRQFLPNYFHAGRLQFRMFWVALPGNLISPSRGLLVFVPTIFFVAYLLLRFRRGLRHRRLVLLALAVIVAQLIVTSGFAHWWGGHSYGPRLMTSLVPWLGMLAILGTRAMLASSAEHGPASPLRRGAVLASGLALLVISVFIHARGAISEATLVWNSRPADVDAAPERLWDWRQPQFLAGLLPPPLPRGFPLIEPNTSIDFTKPQAARYLWYGWSDSEAESRWTDSKEATIVFALGELKPMTLQIKMAPFLVSGKLNSQRVNIKLNGRMLANLSLDNPDANVYSVSLPQDALRQKNVLTFALPDAASPASFDLNEDKRPLGVRVIFAQFLRQ